MKNHIKFGVSINKVGALIVYNFRIRTTSNSYLDKSLENAWDKICKEISGEEFMYNNYTRSDGAKYSIHDFSSCYRGHFFEIFLPIIKRSMLDAKVKNLTEKYKSLHVDIQVQDLPDEEPVESHHLTWDDSCEL